MPYEFTSNRLTAGNLIFRNIVKIDDYYLYYSKRFLTYGFFISRKQKTIPLSSISSVSLVNWPIFSDLTVETRGGGYLHLTGFTHADARSMYDILTPHPIV